MIENSLLAALPGKAYQQLLARLESVTLTFGEVLYEPGDKIRHVFFPGDALVSLLTLADGHLALEVGLIGRDGMVGIPLVLGPTAWMLIREGRTHPETLQEAEVAV